MKINLCDFLIMIPAILLGLILFLGVRSCTGNESINNEIVGQVKKISNVTPLLCPNRMEVDLRLGGMYNGIGSLTTEDAWFLIQNDTDKQKLTDSQMNIKIVKIKYNVRRFVLCGPDHWITSVEIIK